MRAIFRKKLYFEHMLKVKELADDVVDLYRNLSNDNIEWVEELDGKDITRYEVEANKIEKDTHGLETVFVINRYTDYAEWMGRIILHPDWVERIEDEEEIQEGTL